MEWFPQILPPILPQILPQIIFKQTNDLNLFYFKDFLNKNFNLGPHLGHHFGHHLDAPFGPTIWVSPICVQDLGPRFAATVWICDLDQRFKPGPPAFPLQPRRPPFQIKIQGLPENQFWDPKTKKTNCRKFWGKDHLGACICSILVVVSTAVMSVTPVTQ